MAKIPKSCRQSPTKGHFWIVEAPHGTPISNGRCRYCERKRNFNLEKAPIPYSKSNYKSRTKKFGEYRSKETIESF